MKIECMNWQILTFPFRTLSRISQERSGAEQNPFTVCNPVSSYRMCPASFSFGSLDGAEITLFPWQEYWPILLFHLHMQLPTRTPRARMGVFGSCARAWQCQHMLIGQTYTYTLQITSYKLDIFNILRARRSFRTRAPVQPHCMYVYSNYISIISIVLFGPRCGPYTAQPTKRRTKYYIISINII